MDDFDGGVGEDGATMRDRCISNSERPGEDGDSGFAQVNGISTSAEPFVGDVAGGSCDPSANGGGDGVDEDLAWEPLDGESAGASDLQALNRCDEDGDQDSTGEPFREHCNSEPPTDQSDDGFGEGNIPEPFVEGAASDSSERHPDDGEGDVGQDVRSEQNDGFTEYMCMRCAAIRYVAFEVPEEFICTNYGVKCKFKICTMCRLPWILSGLDGVDDERERCRCEVPSFSANHDGDEDDAEEDDDEADDSDMDDEPPALVPGPGSGQSSNSKAVERHTSAHMRDQLLWKVMLREMTAVEAANLFTEKGLEPPTSQELVDFKSRVHRGATVRAHDARSAAKAALKSANKKGPVKRFLNNELVTVSKKDKYIREEKESAEDKAKTSVELYVLGIGRGGRHAVKIAREEKHRGPRSHK
mmetsp:Transcript_46910/g.136476  ORF Transcript_46910/g.136476 Transcript_46910/m.136476 type:complete len:415 (-) Transcript_46910:140-1384(-)